MKKVKMINQLTLGVGLKDEATFANFYPSKNAHLVTALTKSSHGTGEHFLYFYGTGGLGCTHLLQACCHEAHQHKRSAVYIPLANIHDFTPAIFDGLENLNLVCIDEIHRIAGKSDWEEAFFHAYNRILDAGGHLIVTANIAPKGLGLALPDVISRLAWGIVFQMQALTDNEKLQIIIMRAERRGLTLSEEVGKFILNHCPRHMSTLFAALEALDKMSLAAQRKLTIPFVKAVLQI
jgi:DnaA family protein